MKKKVFSLMMTLLLAFMGVARADELTVNDGSTTNSYVPVYGFYADAYLKAEFVQPAADLAAMSGATINGVTFYASVSSVSWGNAMFEVFLTEVDNTTLSTFVGDGTIVYQGALSIVDGMMNVTFTEPYTYNGGNLLVGVYNIAEGTYVSCSWYGVSADGASVQGYSYSDLASVSASQRNFLPKMTFDYTPAGGEVVDVMIGDPTATTTNSYLPTYSLYEKSITQQIYTAEEIGVTGTINSLTMWLKNTSSYARNFNIYMKEVSESEFASTSAWVSMSADDMVATGTLNNGISDPVETTFTLSTPYNYAGGNLVICIADVTGSWSSGAASVVMTTTEYQALYAYRDGTSYDVSNPGVSGTRLQVKSVVSLNITTGGGEGGETFAYDFEDGMDGWTSITNGEGNGWYHSSESMTYSGYDYTGLGHNDSDGFAISQSYTDYDGAIDADNYLVLPQTYAIENGAYLNFFYDYANDSYPDYFEVCVATVDNPTASDFTAIWDVDSRSSAAKTQVRHNNNRYENWREVTVSLNAYVGQTVWIAFHHQDYDEYEVWIDDVTVYTGDAEALIPITEVYINDFEAPVWGQQVTQNVTLPEDANYTLLASGWFSYPHGMFPGREMNPDPIYNLSDRDYVWGFNLVPNEGYAFSPALEAYINGSADNVFIALIVTPDMAQEFPEFPAGSVMIYTYAYYTYEEGLHTLSTYGVGDNAYESVDRLLIERPNGAWMEPYHFQLYNDGEEDVEVVLIDFLHNNGYFSMAEGTEYPITVAATGRPGVDLYINTNTEWTDTEELNSLLAVNTTERSTHLYQIVAAPYQPYCPDVVETAYTITDIDVDEPWSMWTSEMWEETNPNQPYELHNNYTLPFPEIPEGYDAVMTFTLDHDMVLNAYVSDGECDGDEVNGKVALYPADFNGQAGPMADNNYTGRPMSNVPGGGGSQSAYQAQIGEGTSTTGYLPMYYLYNNAMSVQLFLADELTEAGANSAPMNSVSWYSESTYNYNIQNVSIWMANVADNTVSSNSPLGSTMTLVYTGNFQEVVGWNEFVFNQGTFSWDGHSNVLVMVQMNNGNWSSAIQWFSHNPGFQAAGYAYYDYAAYDAANTSYSLTTTSSSRANTLFKSNGGRFEISNRDEFTYGFENGLEGWTALDVNVDGGTWLHSDENPGEYDYTDIAHGGTGFAMCYSYVDYDGAYDTDSYLVSPQQYNIDENSSITFWADNANDTYPESFSVCVSTAANPTAGSFTQVWGGGAKANNGAKAAVRHNNDRYENWREHTVNLGAYAGQSVWIAFHDVNYDAYEIWIDDVTVNAASSAPTPVDPSQPAYTAGPVIEGLNVLAGTYYLVASSTCQDFEVSIDFEELPCPIEAVTNVYPEDNAQGIAPSNLTLRWTLNDYANEWRIVFGSTYYPEDEPNHPATYISEWSSNLAESLRITDYVQLWNNTNYFWRIEQRSNPGTAYECVTSGPVFGFTTSLNAPTNLQVNGAGDANIFETEQNVTLTWNAIQDRTYRRYRIYWNGELYRETPNNQVVTSYTIPNSEFEYNMVPHTDELFYVTAVYDEGESPASNTVAVHVSGYGSVSGTVYEQDETTPIGGVTVMIQGTNEFGNPETYTFTTDANGYYEGEVHVGEYHSAIASMEGYQTASTTHALPFDVVYDEETDHVDFILDELFVAPAHVCAQTTYVEGVEGDSLVHVWWDFDFYNALIEDFEDFENTPFEWENSANYPWTITNYNPYEGTYCLKSGGAGVNNVVSDLSVTVDIPNDGIMSFYVKASCENNWDFGYFYIDGEQRGSYTGAGNWGEKQFAITAGTHTFRWSYQKDGSVNSNDDCIYLDYIQFNRLPEPPVAGNTYDFENGMQGWTEIDADGDGYSWMLATEVMGEGYGNNASTDCAVSQSYNNNVGVLYPDNYLVSPQVQLGGIVKFYACAQDASYAAEHFGVAVSTTNGTSASAFTTIQEWTMSAKSGGEAKPVYRNTRSGRAQGNWYEYTVDMSAYAGQTGYVAIRHFNCSDMFYLDVDDILIGDANRGKAMEETRSLHHYNIYRTDCYNDGPYNSDNTTFLSTVWRPDTAYFDVQWPQVPVGVYKYGVSAVYSGNYDGNPNNPRIDYPFEERESEIVWHNMCSPCIDKDMYLENEVTVNVVLNSADSPEGVQVSFENVNPGEQVNHPQAGVTLDQTGYYVFPRFRKGNYNVTVSLPGYETITAYEEIWEPTDLRYVLIEIICKVQNLYVSRTGWAMWDPQTPCPGGAVPDPDDPTGGDATSFTEGFEGGLNGWNVLTVNADGGSWIHSDNNLGGYDYTTLAHGGTGFAMCYSFVDYDGSYDTDSYLYTPQKYDIVNGSTLTFWADNANDSYPESFSVCVSTADTPTASSFTQVWSGAAKANGNAKANVRHDANRYENWRSHSVDLSAYAGQSVYIAFHDVNYDMYEVWIDDVALTAGRAVAEERHLEGYKIMCTSIDGEPIFNHNTVAEQPFCQLATDQLVEGETYICKVAAIYSTGMSEYEQVEWQYGSCESYAGTVNGLAVEGSTVSWDYPGGQPGPGPEPGEASTFNVDFEGGLPTGWTVNDANNDGYTWCATSAIPSTWTYYAGMSLDWYHSGSDAMCSGSYINGVGALTPNDYLISPQVTLAAGSQLSFWVAATDANYAADHFGVFVSTTGTNPSDFTSVQEWTLTGKSEGKAGSPASRDGRGLRIGTWYNYTVDLSAYAGQAYIAFRHFNCSDQYIMCLDDVTLSAGSKGTVYTPEDYIKMNSLAPMNDGDINPLPVVAGNGRGNDAYACNAYGGTNPTGWITYDVDAPTAGTSLNANLTVYGGSIAADGYVYATYNDNTWKKIDPLTGTVAAQGNLGMFFVDCTYDYTTDMMYGSYSGTLYTWDLTTHTTAEVGQMHGSMQMIACDLNGQMYGIEYQTGDFYAIDKTTGACTQIGTTGYSPAYVQSGGFDHNTGKLYWAGYTSTGIFAEINLTTGAATILGNNVGEQLSWCVPYEYNPGPVPPTPSDEGILGAMIFVDGEWEAFVEYPTNTYTYEGDGQEICVRMVYDGTAELPSNNFYYAMSCEECIGGLEPVCEPGAPIYGEITADDQVRIYWDNEPGPQPGEGDTFEYNFDNSSLDGLTLIDADGDGNNWMLGSVAMTTGYGHNGSTDMILSKSYDNNYGALTPDNYIVFPQSAITTGSTFSFWACGQDASWASEHFGVAVSTTGNTSASDFTTVAEWTMTAKGTKAVRDGRDQGNWYNYTVDLSNYAGMEVYIAIRHFNCTDMFYLDVDDVMLGIANKGNRDGIIGYNIYRSEDNVDYALAGTVPGTATEYFDNPGEGTFYYQVTAVYANCESEPAVSGENPDVNYVIVGRTGIGENSIEVNLFPNPTKGNVTIQAMNMHRITVVSVLGQVVFDTELDQDEYILNMAKFNTGMYMVRVYTDEGVTVKRVTVLH